MLFSQPKPTTKTPAALGWFTNPDNIFLVFSKSSPNWEHPWGCSKWCTPSILPFINLLPSLANIAQVLFMQPTVFTIHISFRIPTSPFSRTYPLKYISFSFTVFSNFFDSNLYSNIPSKPVFILWLCTHCPTFISSLALPMLYPYFNTSLSLSIFLIAIA